uniref:Uncharacterized protein n=1 Tax=Cyanistes caeruleus TaxID=156563 RepID=A0A8C0U6R3_CYACU
IIILRKGTQSPFKAVSPMTTQGHLLPPRGFIFPSLGVVLSIPSVKDLHRSHGIDSQCPPLSRCVGTPLQCEIPIPSLRHIFPAAVLDPPWHSAVAVVVPRLFEITTQCT